MIYPKAYMTIKELSALGLSAGNLRDIAAKEGFPLVIRESNKKTSPIKFDTDELNKYFKRRTNLWEGART